MPRQSKFITYLKKLRKYFFVHHTIPSFEMLTELLDVKSKSVVHRFFQQLVEQDYCYKEGSQYIPTAKLGSLPAYESISAGFPSPGGDSLRYDMNIQEHLVTKPNSMLILKVKGDSMKNAGIVENDMVIIDTAISPKKGDMVVAEIDDEFTLKYLLEDKNKGKYLQPANDEYDPIYPEETLMILGVVTESFRSYNN